MHKLDFVGINLWMEDVMWIRFWHCHLRNVNFMLKIYFKLCLKELHRILLHLYVFIQLGLKNDIVSTILQDL